MAGVVKVAPRWGFSVCAVYRPRRAEGGATDFGRESPAEELSQQQARFRESVPIGRTGTVHEVAPASPYLMASSFVTGQVLAVDGGVMLEK
ncbi:MAG: SDR family oxidoreductase [Actinomycetota bacterium]